MGQADESLDLFDHAVHIADLKEIAGLPVLDALAYARHIRTEADAAHGAVLEHDIGHALVVTRVDNGVRPFDAGLHI